MNMQIKTNPLQEEMVITGTLQPGQAIIRMTADLGSTGTRTQLFTTSDNQLRKGAIVEVPSAFSEVMKGNDVAHLTSKSKSLNDLLEFKITDITEGKEVEYKVFPETRHFVKGGIMQDMGGNVEKAVSDVGKSEQDSTFVNIITNTVLRVLMQQKDTRTRYSGYTIDITLALTNEDTQNMNRLAKFRHKLAGTYKVEMPRLGYTTTLTFKEDSIYIEDESLAVLRYWKTINHELADEFYSVFVIDGGGRSIDIGYLENDRLVNAGCKSLAFGANRIIQETMKHYNSTTTENFTPNTKQITKAVETGLLQRGGQKIAIPQNIHAAKSLVAKDIVSGLNEIFQNSSSITSNSISLILTVGGCFNETGVEDTDSYVPSLTAYLQNEYSKLSPYTQFDQITEQFPIVHGLLYYRLSK